MTLADPFDDLEALLADATARSAHTSALASSRAALRRADIPPDEREALRIQIARLELDVEWTCRGVIANFLQQVCDSCGTVWKCYDGMFLQELHRDGKTKRLLRWPEATLPPQAATVPRARAYKVERIPMCDCCVKERGFAPVINPWEGEL